MTTPMTAAEYETYDEKIRTQAEVLTSLLSAGLQTQDACDAAVRALGNLEQEVQKQLSIARKDLSVLADATATRAATLLAEKFEAADVAAAKAAKRYQQAGRLLGLKTVAVMIGALAVLCAAAWLWVAPLLPSQAEIEFRRAQIVEMEAKAAALARKGVNLEWVDCTVGRLKRTRPCLRSDGMDYSSPGSDLHYAVPYSSRP